jgi:HK97 family phage portal protein
MEWKNLFSWLTKENRAQADIAQSYGEAYTTATATYGNAFDKLEVVNRGVNLIVSAASGLDYDIKDKVVEGVVVGVKQKTLHNLLNFRPNPYQSTQEFRTSIFTDYVLEGNIFIYFDGVFLYHLPAINMVVVPDPKTYVSVYRYNGTTDFRPSEIIHIKDVSSTSIYRGSSRLSSGNRSINSLYKMQDFQDSFFDNGAVLGLVLETDNTLSQLAKERTISNWITKYSPKSGARRPIILDSGLKLKNVGDTNFKDMDFDASIKTHCSKLLMALGVPEVLIDGGNNANISPNLRLFYLETVLPIAKRFTSAIERYFGYDIDVVTSNVSSLQPELKEIASYHATLVNGGIITPNEAREELRYEKKPGQDDIRVPANIAGSAANPSEGGAPKKPKDEPAPKGVL